MIRQFCLLIVLLCSCSAIGFGQSKALKKANELYKDYKYYEAIPIYEEYLEGKYGNGRDIPTKMKLAQSYRRTAQTEKAEPLYAEIVSRPGVNVKQMFYYGQVLMTNGKYSEAKEWFLKYDSEVEDDDRGANMAEACDNVWLIDPRHRSLRLERLDINSDGDDFSPVPFNDGLIFVSDQGKIGKKGGFGWTGRNFLSLYYAKQNASGRFENPKKTFNKITSPQKNMGPIAIHPDGKSIIFTRNSSKAGKGGEFRMQLFEASLSKDGSTGKARLLPFVSPNYNFMHPAYNQDGSVLYFSTDKGGGYGQTDIWMVKRKGDDWGRPENLGELINTQSSEVFPFVGEDDGLYFSSRGLAGLGGFDIFYAPMHEDGFHDEPTNLGAPYNSSKDDMGIYVFPGQKTGYLASNRETGLDDIFSFEAYEIKLIGLVVDEANRPIKDARVTLKAAYELRDQQLDAQARFTDEVAANKTYSVIAQADGYITDSASVSTIGIMDDETLNVRIVLKETKQIIEPPVVYTPPPTPKPEPVVVSKEATEAQQPLTTIRVIDKQSKQPLGNATLLLADGSTQRTDGAGLFMIEPSRARNVKASYPDYFTRRGQLRNKADGTQEVLVELDKIQLNKAIKIENIYYDLDKDFIRADAALELDKIVTLMRDNPTLEIELGSHTDSRGSDAYNMDLSQRRARSAVDYIVSRGTQRYRIVAKGYGETRLTNRCSNGVRCNKTEHQANRRTEFTVTKY